jgi:protein-S-isoprenylcysteine O-methyltransferase Ste14
MIRVEALLRGTWIVWAIAWLILARIKHKKTLKKEDVGSVLKRTLLPLVTLLAAVLLVEQFWPGSLLRPIVSPRPTAQIVFGLGALYLGLAIMFWARFTLGRNWSGLVTLKENHELVTRGPYRFVRHPIYTGVIVALIGTTLVEDNLLCILLVVITTWGFVKKARVEEAYMLETFGARYRDYRLRTGCLVPRLRLRP